MGHDHIGILIKRRRLKKGLTIYRLWKLTKEKVSMRTIRRIESGETMNPGFPTVEAILMALGERFKRE